MYFVSCCFYLYSKMLFQRDKFACKLFPFIWFSIFNTTWRKGEVSLKRVCVPSVFLVWWYDDELLLTGMLTSIHINNSKCLIQFPSKFHSCCGRAKVVVKYGLMVLSVFFYTSWKKTCSQSTSQLVGLWVLQLLMLCLLQLIIIIQIQIDHFLNLHTYIQDNLILLYPSKGAR